MKEPVSLWDAEQYTWNASSPSLSLYSLHMAALSPPDKQDWGVLFVRRTEEETGCTDVGVICQKHPDAEFIFTGEKNKSLKKTQ